MQKVEALRRNLPAGSSGALGASVTDLPVRRFSLDEYHRLVEIGFFDEDERIELIDGVLAPMSPVKPLHAVTIARQVRAFASLLGIDSTYLRVQSPISLPGADSEPEPDLAVVREAETDFAERHPYPDEILLLVEVADSSLARDRSQKAQLYAASKIPEYWIWNLLDLWLEVYRNPQMSAAGDAVYQTKLTFRSGDSVAPLAFPDCVVAVAEVLPAAGER